MSKQPKYIYIYMTSMLWMSAGLKEEEEIHNPTDQLWKMTDNQRLFPVQVSRGFKSCKELDGYMRKNLHSGGSVQQNQLQDLKLNSRIRGHEHLTHCIF